MNLLLLAACLSVLETPARYPMNSPSGTIAVGDFNLDGRPDAAFPYAGSGILAFYWNREGSLHPGPELRLAGAYWVESTDVNGDGRTEVLALGDDTVTIVFTEGGGEFRTVASAVPSGISRFPSYGDFTGDGILDLLARSGNQYLAFQGDASGRFTRIGAPLSFPEQPPSFDDVDGDGKGDAWTLSSGTFALYRSNGDGTFAAPRTLATDEWDWPRPGDFDGDGRTDFLHPAKVRLSSKNHESTDYPPIGTSPAILDVNGDGKSDAVTSWALEISRGDGTFERIPLPFAQQGSAFRLADFNLDGHPDLLSTALTLTFPTPRYNLILRYGRGNNRFEGGTNLINVSSFLTADVNNDGRDDFLASQGGLTVYLGQADRTFRRLAPVADQSGLQLAGDFTNDGKVDLIRSPGQLLVGAGDGTFAAQGGQVPIGRLVVDMNGDGKLDMLGVNNSGALVQHLGDGTGKFTSGTLTAPMGISVFGVGHFDGDTVPDVVAYAGQSLQLIPGASPAAPVKIVDGLMFSNSLLVTDVDGDGDGDILVQPVGADGLRLFRGNRNGIVSSPDNLPGVLRARVFPAVGNFGGDARLDVAISSTTDPMTIVLIQQPDGTFLDSQRFDSGILAQNGAADFDGNGMDDLILREQNGRVAIYPARCAEELIAFTPAVRLTQSSAVSAPGSSFTFTAELSDPSAQGTVTFEGLHDAANIPVVDGRASITVTVPVKARFTVSAIYNGHGRHARGESSMVTHIVDDLPAPGRRRSVRH
ncbi:MAG TPA: VCBS repeat-containing protein [Thermoanaerobaculia bacterium]|nr:VCBS repeat-containing protein [Thermoanaerobaculia bacterium]